MMGLDETGPGESPLPPGQRRQTQWPVLHYGPVPRFKPERWDLQVYGATADGDKHSWDLGEFHELPQART
jgi:DMSO/TMAO reductase YedYZ molybdopterin-dependent catalytic subunit